MAQFTNQATLSYNGTTTTSNIATGELLETLTATKTAVSATYTPGDTVTYVVSLVNSGATPLTGLTITDDLGAYDFGNQTLYPLDYVTGSIQYYQNGVLQTSPPVSTGKPMEITNVTVPANGNATIVYETIVNAYAPNAVGSTIDNQIAVTGGGLVTPVNANETIQALDEALLTISKAISPATVTENSSVTYTFTIQNSGNAEATANANAIVQDTFNPVLSDLTVTFNGTTWTEGTQYTYDAATGVFATTAGAITVPAATYTQDATTGLWTTNPGSSTLTVTGTI